MRLFGGGDKEDGTIGLVLIRLLTRCSMRRGRLWLEKNNGGWGPNKFRKHFWKMLGKTFSLGEFY